MKVVVAGAGEVGFHLAKMLANESQDISVIDLDEEKLQLIESHFDVLTVHGSSTSIAILREARVEDADLLIAVTDSEETNITTSVLAKQLGAKRTIARVNNQEYISESRTIDFKSLGIDNMIFPEELAAKEIRRLMKRAFLTDSFEFAEGRLMLIGIHLKNNAPVINKTVLESAYLNPDLNFMLVAIRRGTETLIPRGDSLFRSNDYLYFIAHPEGVDHIIKIGGGEKFNIKNIMILGGGKVGRMAAQRLENKYNLTLIEMDKEKCFDLTECLQQTLVIRGDGRDIDLLEEEGIANMDAFVAVTGNSETNIISCLVAKKLGVKKTVALVENVDLINISQDIGIDTLINKKLIAASNIFRYIREGDVNALATIHGVDAEVLEFIVKPKSKITNKKIKESKFPRGAIIGGVVRGPNSYITMGEFRIEPRDRVVVFALPEAIHDVENLFK